MDPAFADLFNDSAGPSWLADIKSRGLADEVNFKKDVSVDENTESNVEPSIVAAPVDDEKEKKRRFNAFIREQKAAAEAGDLEAEIAALEGALEVRPTNDKVRRKLEKLKETKMASIAADLKSLSRQQEQRNLPPPIVVDGFKHRPGSSSYQLPGKYKLPAEVFEKLFKYQREAVRWMWELHRKDHGGLLADDMGLGKTVQVAAFLRGLFASRQVETVLIVMPKSVVENWRKELAQWTRRLVLSYDGTARQRERTLEEVGRTGGVVLTTYGMIRSSAHRLRGVVNPESGELEEWDYVVLDEGHKIKNASSEAAKNIRSIGSAHRLVLTGTPVLNRLQELWALLDYAQPDLLGDLNSFRKNYDDLIIRASHKNAKPEHKLMGEEVLARLKTLIQPHFLRRVKDEVFSQRPGKESSEAAGAEKAADGGDDEAMEAQAESDRLLMEKHRIRARKNDLIVWLSMSPAQLEMYDKFLFLPEVKEILNTSKSPLAAITVLKKICQHPRLLHNKMKTLREQASGSGGVKELLEKLSAGPESLVEQSGKLSFMTTLLERLLQEGHRVLIFSQWQKMLDIIGSTLAQRQIEYFRIDGTVNKPEDRQRLIDKFNRGAAGTPNVFLLTTQTGGLGITLTGADRAIIYDPSWNTSDDQAVDRIYRIGQKRNCVIYRLITCGTVEEKIYRKQVFKTGLSRMVSCGTDDQGISGSDIGTRYFTKDELRALFTLENPFESLTQKQLEEKHASRRVTDEELDAHLEFLGTIDNFHGVSDHDLLFDGEARTASTRRSREDDADSTDARLRNVFLDDEAVEVNDEEDEDVMNASRGALDRLSMTVGEQEQEMDERGTLLASDEEDEENEADGEEQDSFVVPDDHVEYEEEQKEEQEVVAKVESKGPEMHYRGPNVDRYGTLKREAKRLESSGRSVEALERYMDAFEAGEAEGRKTDKKMVAKMMELRQQLEEIKEEEEEEEEGNDVQDELVDDDLELFDDEMEEVADSVAGLVIASPEAARKPAEHDESLCVVCMEGAKDICFIPCGHRSVCVKCGDRLLKQQPRRCPICRGAFTSTLRVYL